MSSMFASSCLGRSCQVLITNQTLQEYQTYFHFKPCSIVSVNSICSQELLAAVESEKNLRSRRIVDPENQGNEVDNESDDEQPLMRHVAAIASRARNITRRRRETIPAYGPSQILPSVPINVTLVNGSSLERRNLDSFSLDADSR